MIFYISGDFQHIRPLVESDTAHSAENSRRGPTITFVFLMFPPPFPSLNPLLLLPPLLARGTTFTSKTLLVVKSHPGQTRRFAPRVGNNVNLFQLAGFNLVVGSQLWLCWEPLGGLKGDNVKKEQSLNIKSHSQMCLLY